LFQKIFNPDEIPFGVFILKQMINNEDIRYMRMALGQAACGVGKVNPNPLVGAVIVQNNTVIGSGYHKQFGGPHAEINAIRHANEDIKGATMYVTLEPCSHYGKTPPCVDTLINAGFSRVVIAMQDPNPLVAGKGIEKQRKNGILAEVGLLEAEAMELNRIFIKYIKTGRPYLVLKSAMSLDGKIATVGGHSKWISCHESRQYVHTLRNELKGIMVGVNTVIIDDPQLTTRLNNAKGRNPVRIVVDSKGRIPLTARILQDGENNPVIIATTRQCPDVKCQQLMNAGHKVLILPDKDGLVDLNILMETLGKMEIDGILLEGGGTLNESALRAGIVDEVQFFIAPMLIGGQKAITPVEGCGFESIDESIHLHDLKIKQIGCDILVTGKTNHTLILSDNNPL